MSEWNEQTIRPHLFTEVEVSDDRGSWEKHKLYGFDSDRDPFIAGGTRWRHMRPLQPIPTEAELFLEKWKGKKITWPLRGGGYWVPFRAAKHLVWGHPNGDVNYETNIPIADLMKREIILYEEPTPLDEGELESIIKVLSGELESIIKVLRWAKDRAQKLH